MSLKYLISSENLPGASDLFSDLEDIYSEVEQLRQEITDIFNESEARTFLQGFVIPGKTDIHLVWKGAEAVIEIREV